MLGFLATAIDGAGDAALTGAANGLERVGDQVPTSGGGVAILIGAVLLIGWAQGQRKGGQ